ncbi:MAG: Dolichyl-phosphate-mannose-protein mannosyltransferase [Blastocatellia bacterium]|nr:Dolichyl-phosphate-mannose-protein mannosyltransferase [Blastocatellia bacterium]
MRAAQHTKRAAQPTQGTAQPTRRTTQPRSHPSTLRRLVVQGFIIFLVAFGVRLLAWQDNRFEARKVQTAVTEGYKHAARLLSEDGLASFFNASAPLADTNHLGHPPGYSFLLALLSRLTSDTDTAVQFVQITADALAAVVIFLIALALLSKPVAFIAALLVALAPQFTYNSTLLLPDSISVLPVLLAVYCLTLATRRKATAARSAIGLLVAAGALVGISCWLRANAMMLAPFIALATPLLFARGLRLRFALSLVAGALLVIAPLTVRNAVVYGRFIPVSLGAGQTMLEGIADYDAAGRFGIPATDVGIMKMEAEEYGRPDYYGFLFNPDGILRERLRLKRGFDVIIAHPFWFASVMARRAVSMLRLERVHNISTGPPVTHSLVIDEATPPVWSNAPDVLLASGTKGASLSELSLTSDGMLSINGDDSKRDAQFVSPAFKLRRDTDYLLRLPVHIEQGRMAINVFAAGSNAPLASAIVEPQDWKTSAEQPLQTIEIPFVSRDDTEATIAFANGGSNVRARAEVGRVELYALGQASGVWTRYPRAVVNLLQRLFITAIMLPLALCGLFLLIKRRSLKPLALLLVVPAYYLCFQSALHTEYRYVLAVHYFLFVLVALALHALGTIALSSLMKLSLARRLLRGLRKETTAAAA